MIMMLMMIMMMAIMLRSFSLLTADKLPPSVKSAEHQLFQVPILQLVLFTSQFNPSLRYYKTPSSYVSNNHQ